MPPEFVSGQPGIQRAIRQFIASSLFGLALLLFAQPVQAHPFLHNSWWVLMDPQKIHMRVTVTLREVAVVQGLPLTPGRVDIDALVDALAKHGDYVTETMQVSLANTPLESRVLDYQLVSGNIAAEPLDSPQYLDMTHAAFDLEADLPSNPPSGPWRFVQKTLEGHEYAPGVPWDVTYAFTLRDEDRRDRARGFIRADLPFEYTPPTAVPPSKPPQVLGGSPRSSTTPQNAPDSSPANAAAAQQQSSVQLITQGNFAANVQPTPPQVNSPSNAGFSGEPESEPDTATNTEGGPEPKMEIEIYAGSDAPNASPQASSSNAVSNATDLKDSGKVDFLTSTDPIPISDSWRAFFRHGIHHVLTGYDHLLFLAALTLVTRTFGQLFRIILVFTIAHSITVTASVFGWIAAPSWLIEPIIAISIIHVAVQNVISNDSARGGARLFIAFAFGLVHGLGFAGGLEDMLDSESARDLGIVVAAFCGGVEAGHLIVGIPLSGIFRAIQFNPDARGTADAYSDRLHPMVKWGSVAIALGGCYYLWAALQSFL